MNRITGLILGLIIIFIGFSIIFTGFSIILFILKFVIGLAIVYVGIKAITGGFGEKKNDKRDIFFSENNIKDFDSHDKQYNVVFAKGVFDFRDKLTTDKDIDIKIGVVFGNAIIKLKKEQLFKIVSNTVFGSIKMPDENTSTFGSLKYSNTEKTNDFLLQLKIDVVFGNVSFEIE